VDIISLPPINYNADYNSGRIGSQELSAPGIALPGDESHLGNLFPIAHLHLQEKTSSEDGGMSDFEYRMKHNLETILELSDPRERIDAQCGWSPRRCGVFLQIA
jgi:hypothetical protein